MKNSAFSLYIVSFLFSLQTALPSYITSTFLTGFMSERFVGLLYTLSSILAIISLAIIPRMLAQFGNRKTVLVFFVLEIVSLVALAFGKSLSIVAPAFILNFVTFSVASFNLDIFLEECSASASVGKVRGFFLTIGNSAWVLSALLGGLILSGTNYYRIYLGSALLMIPVLGIIAEKFKHFKDPLYHKVSLLKTCLEVWGNKDILGIFLANFLLQFFYSWMVIYTPIYLFEHIGWGWSEIGLLFSIMLLPFPLLESILGKLADKRFGEKEILSLGFIIMAISTALIAFIPGKNFLIWAIILFTTRVGAATVEVMSETYFFKKVSDTKPSAVSLFRMMRPLGYLVSPIVATAFLTFFDIQYLFIFLGLLMFYGLRFALNIKDTK